MIVGLIQVIILATIALIALKAKDPLIIGMMLFVIPFLVLHWVLDTDRCVFTKIEAWLRGCNISESWLHQILTGVYRINHLSISPLLYIAAILLWAQAFYKFSQDPEVQATAMKVIS